MILIRGKDNETKWFGMTTGLATAFADREGTEGDGWLIVTIHYVIFAASSTVDA